MTEGPKRIVLLLDGTSNEIKSTRTNILRLYGTLEKSDDQLVYYDPGVGTFGADNAWSRTWRKTVEIWGMATGWGLDKNVKDAYRFLIANYRSGTDAEGNKWHDEIAIFGFSRGAYSARVLAGFLRAFGLIETRNLNLVNYAYRAYKRIGERTDEGAFDEIRLYERILRPAQVPVRFLGLFDTVPSVIEAGRFGPRLKFHAFTANNFMVQTVRHAVSTDERRTMFRAQLWPMGQVYKTNPFDPNPGKQDAKEVWFAGDHGDVGGGHPEAESGLAKIPLYWMIEAAKGAGLTFKTRTVNEIVLGQNPKRDYVRPNPLAPTHDSMSFGWRLLEYLPRRKPAESRRPSFMGLCIPMAEPRLIPDGASVCASVLKRPVPPVNLPDHYDEEPDPAEEWEDGA